MARINIRRVLIGGVVAGVVMNVMDAVTNGVLMLAEWRANSTRLGLDPAAAEGVANLVILAAVDVLFGIVLVWLYAAMQPRYGATVRTALLAAAAMFVATMGIIIGFVLMGVLTPWLLVQMAIAGAVTLAAGAVAGARFYRD